MASSPLSRTAIAISAYRSDESVLRLLEQVFAEGGAEAAAVIVVDSQNSGSLQQALKNRGWPVRYENAETNLGSAGNLARRLRLAASIKDADWCFALNHDGMFRRGLVEALVQHGEPRERVGAVFPRRVMIDREHSVLQPHRHVFDMPRFWQAAEPAAPLQEVAWDSSNGALYSLQPVRDGLLPWADLWMGWEDLAYGWLLQRHGWKQLYCEAAEFLDDYEYSRVSLFGRRLFITRKPAWYAYYVVRNLLLILRRTGAGIGGWRFFMQRLGRELLFTLLFRSEKWRRLRFLALGLVDGLRGVAGRGRGMA